MTKPMSGRAANQPIVKATDLGFAGEVTQDFLHRVLAYEPVTGEFRWKVRLANCTRAGEPAGSIHTTQCGYRFLTLHLGGKNLKAHRVAWMYVYGVWPVNFIDHIDGNALNNQIANLRDVDACVNLQNQRRAKADSSTGLLGVHVSRNKFAAVITVRGKRIRIGTFETSMEAHAAYLHSKRDLHEGNTL